MGRAPHVTGYRRFAITAQFVRSCLDYDPVTGIFTWRQRADRDLSWNAKYAGQVAGTPNGDGQIRIQLNSGNYVAHMLAWLYMTGEWSPREIDHIDVDNSHNWWTNLRIATRSQNGANRPAPKSNTSGIKGVSKDSAGRPGKWQAKITVNMRQIHLGVFDCRAAAAFAFMVASDRHFGEFARTI